jgi:integrase
LIRSINEVRIRLVSISRYLYFGAICLRAGLPAHQRVILVIGYHPGFRLGEILALRWVQVDWTANLIRPEKKQTRGKQARVAPLYGELRSWLEMAASDKDRRLTIVSL